MKIVGAIFEKIKILNFFLMWTTLNFRGRGKTKRTARDIYMRTLGIECERDRSIGLGATLGDGQKIKNNFSSFRDFSVEADSVTLLGFECTIKAQTLIKIVGAIFEKIKILNFFLMWTTLNFRGRRKLKTARDIYTMTLDIKFERDRSIGLGHGCANHATEGKRFSSPSTAVT